MPPLSVEILTGKLDVESRFSTNSPSSEEFMEIL